MDRDREFVPFAPGRPASTLDLMVISRGTFRQATRCVGEDLGQTDDSACICSISAFARRRSSKAVYKHAYPGLFRSDRVSGLRLLRRRLHHSHLSFRIVIRAPTGLDRRDDLNSLALHSPAFSVSHLCRHEYSGSCTKHGRVLTTYRLAARPRRSRPTRRQLSRLESTTNNPSQPSIPFSTPDWAASRICGSLNSGPSTLIQRSGMFPEDHFTHDKRVGTPR